MTATVAHRSATVVLELADEPVLDLSGEAYGIRKLLPRSVEIGYMFDPTQGDAGWVLSRAVVAGSLVKVDGTPGVRTDSKSYWWIENAPAWLAALIRSHTPTEA